MPTKKSLANGYLVRQKPVAISLKINSTPFLSYNGKAQINHRGIQVDALILELKLLLHLHLLPESPQR